MTKRVAVGIGILAQFEQEFHMTTATSGMTVRGMEMRGLARAKIKQRDRSGSILGTMKRRDSSIDLPSAIGCRASGHGTGGDR